MGMNCTLHGDLLVGDWFKGFFSGVRGDELTGRGHPYKLMCKIYLEKVFKVPKYVSRILWTQEVLAKSKILISVLHNQNNKFVSTHQFTKYVGIYRQSLVKNTS